MKKKESKMFFTLLNKRNLLIALAIVVFLLALEKILNAIVGLPENFSYIVASVTQLSAVTIAPLILLITDKDKKRKIVWAIAFILLLIFSIYKSISIFS